MPPQLILPPAIARVRIALPGVAVELVGLDPEDEVELVRKGEADAAMVTEVPGEQPEFPGVDTVAVYDDAFSIITTAFI